MEITLKFGNSYKDVLSIQCKDYYKEFLYGLNMSVLLPCIKGRKCYYHTYWTVKGDKCNPPQNMADSSCA